MARSTEKRPGGQAYLLAVAAIVIAATAGCHPTASSDDSSRPSAASVAAGQEKAIKDIEANPHIPAQVKQNVLRQMRGQFTPPPTSGTPGTPPPPGASPAH